MVITYAILLILTLVIGYWLGIFTGAHYMPTTDAQVILMLRLAHLTPGEKLADIGSGDGKILIAAAQQGIESHGYEINPLLVLWSRARIRRAGMQRLAFVHMKSFWNANLSEYSVVTVYGIPHIMGFLEKKLEKELTPGSRVVCNAFPLAHYQYHWDMTDEGNVSVFRRV